MSSACSISANFSAQNPPIECPIRMIGAGSWRYSRIAIAAMTRQIVNSLTLAVTPACLIPFVRQTTPRERTGARGALSREGGGGFVEPPDGGGSRPLFGLCPPAPAGARHCRIEAAIEDAG